MFTNLGLFAQHNCPDSTCNRTSCLFAHTDVFKLAPRPGTPAGASPAKRARPQVAPVTTSTYVQRASPRPSAVVSHAALPAQAPPPAVTSSPQRVATPAAAAPRSAALNGSTGVGVGPPSLPPSKFSPQPFADRQKALRTLHTQFAKLYSAILPLQPNLASESTLAQEKDISSSTNNVKAYRLAIHQAAMSISRRQPPPDRIPHPSIGTVKESRAATEAEAKSKASRLTPVRLEPYRVDVSTLVDWGYPDPVDLAMQTELEPDPSGTIRTCDRCKVEFVVTASNETGPCLYHYGRLAPEHREGRRMWLYTCCGKERGSAGCEDSIHVFSFKEDDRKLAAYAPYLSTRDVAASRGNTPKAVDVVGMDCEMIYTTGGSWLGRVTVVDEDGNTLLDEFVRQTHHVLDCNKRFSGIEEHQLDSAAMDLGQVREAVCSFISPETYVIGHGLENDFRALRLLHDRVVDTAILFPHDKGRPYRRALRDLVKEKLGYFIQQSSDAGHSSAEDASAAIEVVKWKVREDST